MDFIIFIILFAHTVSTYFQRLTDKPIPGNADIEQMPYLVATVNEVLRLSNIGLYTKQKLLPWHNFKFLSFKSVQVYWQIDKGVFGHNINKHL